MDTLTLARWEFALTAGVHFLLVATTLGLAPVVAGLQTVTWRRARRAAADASALVPARDRLLRLYLFNYGAGIVSGIVMELQMGLNWAGHHSALYDPIAVVLGIETLAAFFVESTLLGLFLVTAGRIGEGWRAAMLWGVALTAWLSAWVVLAANAYLHHPVGVTLVDGRAQFTDPWAVLTQVPAVMAWGHVLGAAGLVGAAWLTAAGAHLSLSRTPHPSPKIDATSTGLHGRTAQLLLRTGVLIWALAAPVTVATGFGQLMVEVRDQTMTNYGWHGLLLAIMLFTGLGMLLVGWLVALPLLLTGRLARGRPVLRMLTVAPWPPLALTIAGWVYREEARQPWFIVGEVTIAEALSAPGPWQLAVTSTAFVTVGVAALLAAWRLMSQEIRRPLSMAGPGTASPLKVGQAPL